MIFDVVVVGGGPAGAIAAWFLRQAGLTALIIEARAGAAERAGEILSGAAADVLRGLGIAERFAAQGHTPYPAVRGWQLDGGSFDELLLRAAAAKGASVARGVAVDGASWDGAQWRVQIAGSSLSARFLVDAGGRGAGLARKLGARRTRIDRMVALVHRYASREGDRGEQGDPARAIEPSVEGWWTTACLPRGELLAVFTTDADLLATRRRSPDPAPRAQARIGAAPLCERPRLVSAASGLTLRPASDRRPWLAAGDAAASFDPSCSDGIGFALRSGQRAAQAARRALVGDESAIATYDADVARQFDAFLGDRAHHYAAHSRFANWPFWRRRRQQAAALAA